jgi:hypothetical protein
MFAAAMARKVIASAIGTDGKPVYGFWIRR